MSRILIYTDVVPFGEYDIFQKTKHDRLQALIPEIYGGRCPNFGNRLWFQGIISEISTEDNVIDYWDSAKSFDEINDLYDMVIAPMANVFSIGFRGLLDKLAERFAKITIPVYVIACGVQADSYDKLDEVCDAIKEPATRFMSAVYDSGGEFALRGFFSKEFFDRLGFHSAVVTGCPSLYQLGRSSTVESNFERAKLCDFSPIVNGNLEDCLPYLSNYPHCQFIDQHTYYDLLYGNILNEDTIQMSAILGLIRQYGLREFHMLAGERVQLFPDMGSWMAFLRAGGFQFSFGSRIHGNIMSILSGIPAMVYACDSRTREMAEFFHIPMVLRSANTSDKLDLYELYQTIDYSGYNSHIGEKYDNFESFLQEHGIVQKINTNNQFFRPQEEPDEVNRSGLQAANQLLEKHRISLELYDFLLRLSRKVRGLA